MKTQKEELKCKHCGKIKLFPATVIAAGRLYCSRECFKEEKNFNGGEEFKYEIIKPKENI